MWWAEGEGQNPIKGFVLSAPGLRAFKSWLRTVWAEAGMAIARGPTMDNRKSRWAFWFVQTGGNGAAAARHAGFPPSSMRGVARYMLRDDRVLQMIVQQIKLGAPGHEAALRRLLMKQRPKASRERVAELMLATWTSPTASEILLGVGQNPANSSIPQPQAAD